MSVKRKDIIKVFEDNGFSQNGVAMLSSVLRSKQACFQDLLDRGNTKDLTKI